MSGTYAQVAAHNALLRAALRCIAADYFADDADPHADAESEYAGERLALAARELVAAVDALPEGDQPVRWEPTVAEDGNADRAGLQQTAEAEAGLRQALVDADGAVTAAEAERDVALAERDQARVIARILNRRDANLHLEYEIRLGLGPLPGWLTEGGDPA